MINKTKKYIGFFAATLNIIASALFVIAMTTTSSDLDSSNVTSSTGLWFATASLILWVIYIALALTNHKK